MEIIVLDTYALIKWLTGESGHDIVANYLRTGDIYMSSVNFGETYYRLAKSGLRNEAENLWINKDLFPITYIHPNWRRIRQAAEVKANYAVSYADAFCISLALEMEARIITGDPEFKNIKGIELIWVGENWA
ncbi:MAG: type II toxin-antitoxin system VapC family toxin [Deltaproteobacteria bacterium]|nr:MAG: type II toxin-antitoxin system VapC family toxin [Deltaproteobacteria bacterium]